MRRFFSIILSVIFAPGLLIYSVFGSFFVYAFQIFGKRARVRVAHVFCSVWNWLLVAVTLSRVRVVGRENIPRGEPYVAYVNHSSFIDIPVLSGYVIPEAAYAGRKELSRGPAGMWILACDGVLIERKGTKRELKLILKMVERIKAGRPFIVFPEGTRAHSDELGKLMPGSLKIAQKARAKMLPIRIEGTRKILPRGGKWPKPGDVTVVIGEPIPPEEIDKDSSAVLEKLRQFLSGNN